MATQLELIPISSFERQTKTVSRDKNKDRLTKSSLPNLAKSETKLLRLIDRIILGGVIPFLGAGLSLESKGPNGKNIAGTGEMTCSVCRQLLKELSAKSGCRIGNKSCCGNPKKSCGNKRGLAEVCEEYLWDQGKLKELVLKVLRIQDFTGLEITKAHRYIAYLVRESVIEEVITSNYDICLERAYQESLDSDYVSEKYGISNLQHYRAVAGIRQQSTQPVQLKVYHINGCASDLEGPCKDRICESILLTERQLQHWGNRQWGRDLLRDRLRCKNIVFSGFGSPEPQVRHTVLQVLEEFELDSPNNKHTHNISKSEEDCWKAPNAVFVHAYEDLTFEQKQVLTAYANASGANGTSVKSIVESGNCFTPRDAPLFGKELNACLPADEFWKYVYKAVFWRLLTRDWLSYGSSFYYLLLSSISCADVLLNEIRNWLLPDSNSNPASERLFGRFSEYLDICRENSSVLSEHIWHIRHRRLPFRCGWYASLKEKGIIISSYFTLVYLLGSQNKAKQGRQSWAELKKIIKLSPSLGLGLKFSFGRDSVHKSLLVLSHRESLFQAGEQIWGELGDYNFIVQVVIDGDFSPKRVRVRLEKNSNASIGGTKRVKYFSVYQLSFLDLLGRGNRKPADMAELRETLRQKLLFPSLVIDRSKQRVRNRGRIRRDLNGTGHR